MNLDSFKNLVNLMVKPLKNRVYTMITRAIIESANDNDGMQVVKLNLLAGETRGDVERFQNFGFSSNPPMNAECVALAMGGNRDHLIVVVADDRATRVKGLEPGESVFFNAGGDKLTFKNSGNLEGVISKNMEILLDKLKIENGTAEIITLLIELAQTLSIEPMIVNKSTFSIIKTKLETFKVG